ncbi:MAG: PilZ domain [Myxococcaceae bacterium]|nr:PilZ domain [Myxococcaceae bacterium]
MVAYIAHMKSFDRRSAPRVAVTVSVQQHVEGETHGCIANNLSLSGLYMERPISSFVRHSAEIELELPLPDGAEPLWTRAEIVYDCFGAQFHGTAVRFTQMSARDRARLSAFLSPMAVVHESARTAVS